MASFLFLSGHRYFLSKKSWLVQYELVHPCLIAINFLNRSIFYILRMIVVCEFMITAFADV